MKIRIFVYDDDTDLRNGFAPHDIETVSSFVQAEEALARLQRHYERRKVEANNIIPEDES